MTEERAKRKLAAIFSADVKGYSRLMADDEEATVRTITAYREVMTSLIKEHRGRVADAKGDNVLAEFASVVDAVRCAVGIQKELKDKNADLSEQRRMEFRIGINLGDVIEEEGTIYGDGVNVAARLEGLAEGGGICISGTAFDHVKNRIPVGYEYQGKQSVKNIPDPVRVYRVLPEAEAAGKVIGEREPRPTRRRWAALAAAVFLAVVAGGLIWNFYFRPPPIEPASKEKMAFPLPDKPSVAVLPFKNLSGNREQEFLADGITESIIGAISRVSGLFVIASNSVFAYKGKPIRVQTVSEELGVRNILEGTVQRVGNRLRVNAQLIDATTGRHLWSEKYDREMKDIFALQDDISMEILTALRVKLIEGEQARVWAKGTSNLEAYLKFLRAYEHFKSFSKQNMILLRQICEEAIALDPNYESAYSLSGVSHLMDVWNGWTESPRSSIEKSEAAVMKALALNPQSDFAYANLGHLHLVQERFEEAVAAGEKSVALNPNGDYNMAVLGITFNYVRRYEAAITLFTEAQRRNPYGPAWYITNLGVSYVKSGRWDEGIAEYKRALERKPDHFPALVALAAAYGAAGREEEGRAVAVQVLKINPRFCTQAWHLPYKYKSDAEESRNWLRKVGIPDKPPLPLPDKPSIAVLPFVNMSDEKSQEFFSDGLTEEIITALSKTPQLFVIASNTAFTYKGSPVKVKQASEEMGVRYVLEGSVRKAGERIRITAQLVDAPKDHHLWGERYDRELKDLFAVQDDITKNIVTAVHVNLTEGERSRVFAKGTSNLQAYLKTSEAQWHLAQFTKEGVLAGQRLAEEAIALDPDYAYAHMTLGSAHGYSLYLQTTASPADSLKRCIESMQKAVALDESSGEAHATLAYWLVLGKQYDRGLAECEKAMALAPYSDRVLHACAATLTFLGKRDEAIPIFREALRINPKPPAMYYRHFAVALRDSGRFDEGIALMKRLIERNPNDVTAYVILASSLGLAGREEEARTTAKEILRINPAFSLERFEKTSPHKDRDVVERFIEALRKAGLT